MLEGPIIVGDELIWEPRDPKAYERITVVAVVNGWIQTSGKRGTFWNDEDRVREACVRVASRTEAVWSSGSSSGS